MSLSPSFLRAGGFRRHSLYFPTLIGQVYVQTVKVDLKGVVRLPPRYRVEKWTAFDIGLTFAFWLM